MTQEETTALDRAVQELDGDVDLTGLGGLGECRFLLEVAGARYGFAVGPEGLRQEGDTGINSTWDFQLTLDDTAWQALCSDTPPRGFTSAQAVVATQGASVISGNRRIWARYAGVLDRVVAALRDRVRGGAHPRNADPARRTSGLSPIVGRYLTVEVGGEPRRIYFEEAGQGQPVLCLHTAGADSRQFRYLLEDEELLQRYRFIAFDMPWHGRSEPPDDWSSQRYALTTETYAETVLAVQGALQLEQPILMGCSMGGAIALYLASRHGDSYRGVCALEGGLGNPGRFVSWTNSTEVDHSQFLTSWVGGLIAPSSPTAPRNQTLWGYAQSGPGVYQGDTHFYSNDLPQVAPSLQPASCPLYVFSGEYDYSATTEMSREAAERLGGVLVEMKGSGHFPMSEDPEVFLGYLLPVLDKLSAGPGAA
jgi:pimeloyl-ACP methyl ester carboxylesterase